MHDLPSGLCTALQVLLYFFAAYSYAIECARGCGSHLPQSQVAFLYSVHAFVAEDAFLIAFCNDSHKVGRAYSRLFEIGGVFLQSVDKFAVCISTRRKAFAYNVRRLFVAYAELLCNTVGCLQRFAKIRVESVANAANLVPQVL